MTLTPPVCASCSLDFSLPALLRSRLGYFLLKCGLECTDSGTKLLDFLEDVIAFRLCVSPHSRQQQCVALTPPAATVIIGHLRCKDLHNMQ